MVRLFHLPAAGYFQAPVSVAEEENLVVWDPDAPLGMPAEAHWFISIWRPIHLIGNYMHHRSDPARPRLTCKCNIHGTFAGRREDMQQRNKNDHDDILLLIVADQVQLLSLSIPRWFHVTSHDVGVSVQSEYQNVISETVSLNRVMRISVGLSHLSKDAAEPAAGRGVINTVTGVNIS
eukprot:g6924.t1